MTPERACSVTYACAWLHNRACPADADIADIDMPQPDNIPISEEMVVNPTEKPGLLPAKLPAQHTLSNSSIVMSKH